MDLNDHQAPDRPDSRRLLRAHCVGGAVFLLLQSLPVFIPDICLKCFSEPAARAAAAFLGTPLSIQPDSISLAHPSIYVAVTEACSGFDFFTLITALLIGLAVFRQRSQLLFRDACLLPILVYGLTLFGNTSRIVCAVQIRTTTGDLIPASFGPIIHQSIGVIVFVTVLTLAWTTLTKFYDRQLST